MASGVYNRFKKNLMCGLVDLDGSGAHVTQVALFVNTYTFDADHNVYTEIVADEVAAAGNYSTGGATLAGSAVTQDDAGDESEWDATDTTWSSSTITARYAILYDDTLVTQDLIACIDFGSDQSSSSGDFTIQWNAEGIINIG